MTGVELLRAAAFLANQKDRRARACADIAGDERIQALNAMREAHAYEKIERAIDGRRLGLRRVGVEQVQEIVGLCRPMLVEQDFEHAPAQRRQALVR